MELKQRLAVIFLAILRIVQPQAVENVCETDVHELFYLYFNACRLNSTFAAYTKRLLFIDMRGAVHMKSAKSQDVERIKAKVDQICKWWIEPVVLPKHAVLELQKNAYLISTAVRDKFSKDNENVQYLIMGDIIHQTYAIVFMQSVSDQLKKQRSIPCEGELFVPGRIASLPMFSMCTPDGVHVSDIDAYNNLIAEQNVERISQNDKELAGLSVAFEVKTILCDTIERHQIDKCRQDLSFFFKNALYIMQERKTHKYVCAKRLSHQTSCSSQKPSGGTSSSTHKVRKTHKFKSVKKIPRNVLLFQLQEHEYKFTRMWNSNKVNDIFVGVIDHDNKLVSEKVQADQAKFCLNLTNSYVEQVIEQKILLKPYSTDELISVLIMVFTAQGTNIPIGYVAFCINLTDEACTPYTDNVTKFINQYLQHLR